MRLGRQEPRSYDVVMVEGPMRFLNDGDAERFQRDILQFHKMKKVAIDYIRENNVFWAGDHIKLKAYNELLAKGDKVITSLESSHNMWEMAFRMAWYVAKGVPLPEHFHPNGITLTLRSFTQPRRNPIWTIYTKKSGPYKVEWEPDELWKSWRCLPANAVCIYPLYTLGQEPDWMIGVRCYRYHLPDVDSVVQSIVRDLRRQGKEAYYWKGKETATLPDLVSR